MLPELGQWSLILAFNLALMQIVIYKTKISKTEIIRTLTIGQSFFLVMAFSLLAISFLLDDFSITYIWQNSNASLPFYYKLTAIWGAHEGSLLLWVLILNIWSLVIVYIRNLESYFKNKVLFYFGCVNIGILAILLFSSNPFSRTLIDIPVDGNDLNPMLQDMAMILHPPILYIGYIGTTVGFAFAMASISSGKINKAWAQRLYPFIAISWAFLTLGITLGSWWAYYELGWGGWWFWDPVENASFMPWLCTTALLHTLHVAKKEGHLLASSIILALASFLLSIFGTFLVRSGSIMSVHSFAKDPKRGVMFLVLLCLLCLLPTILLLTKIKLFKDIVSKNISRKTFLIFANAILLFVATLSILLGTVFPLVYEYIFNETIFVGFPYFNMVFIPSMLMLFMIMFIYFNTSFKAFMLNLVISICIATLFLHALFANVKFAPFLGVLCSILIITSTLRYKKLGVNLAHLGLALIVIGVSITPNYEIEKDIQLKVGQDFDLANHNVNFSHIYPIDGPNYVGFRGDFTIDYKNKTYMLHPEKRTYLANKISMSETAILSGILRDIYIALGQSLDDGTWSVRIYYKPCVRFIWLGALIMICGAIYSVALHIFRKKVDHSLQVSNNGVRVCNYVG